MNKIVLVGFLAEWCGACKVQDPILDELKLNMGDRVDIIKIDVDKDRDLINGFKINATPTLFLLKNNQIFKKYVGVTSRNDIEKAINGAMN